MELMSVIVGILIGIFIGAAIGSMSMKRSGGGSTAARKVVVTTPNNAQLLTAEEAQRMSKIHHLVWMWAPHGKRYPGVEDPLGDGSTGAWCLRPVMAPTDIDVAQGTFIVHQWSERRTCWIPKLQCRSLKQIDQKLIQQGDRPATNEMLAHYFERVIMSGTDEPEHPQARDGPTQLTVLANHFGTASLQ